MAIVTTKTKRKAICANRGGWQTASDVQINNFWDSLGKTAQTEYLASISDKQSAISNKQKGDADVSDRS